MSTDFFGSEFFGGGFFTGGAAPEVTAPVIPGGVRRGRKLRIFPDKKRLFLTEQEAITVLLGYYHEQKLKASEAEFLGLKPNRKKVIVSPEERTEIREALDMVDDKWKVRRQEEEWLVTLH